MAFSPSGVTVIKAAPVEVSGRTSTRVVSTPLFPKVPNQSFPEGVCAHSPEQSYLGTEKGGSDGLISSLSARVGKKFGVGYRLSGLRSTLQLRHEVLVQGAHYENFGHSHPLLTHKRCHKRTERLSRVRPRHAARSPNYEFCFQSSRFRFAVLLQLFQEHLSGHDPEFLCRLGDSRDGRFHQFEPRDVVEAGDRDVLRYSAPGFSCGLQSTKAHEVIHYKNRRRLLAELKELPHRPPSTLPSEVS
jgi:hypothetical protein